MTSLQQRFIEDMQVRNFSPVTQASYAREVSGFARYFNKSPELLGPEQIRAYQVYLTNERKLGVVSISVACAYRKLHPAVSRQMSHCYFPVAFFTQAPVPFLHLIDFKGIRRGWDLRNTVARTEFSRSTDAMIAGILSEKSESSFAPSHSFCRCTRFWRGTTRCSRQIDEFEDTLTRIIAIVLETISYS
jgi:hypothetical protein